MTGLFVILGFLGALGGTIFLTWYAIRRINQGAPGWVAQDDEERLGTGPCPKGEEGKEGEPGQKGKAA